MEKEKTIPQNVDEYIKDFPEETQNILQELRATIKKIAPEAEEMIGYAIPSFKLNNVYLVHFAAFKNHIGFYATPSGNEAFKKEISHYKTGKGSVQFPLDKPMPLNLITQIVQFRVEEILDKAKTKGKKK